MANSSLSGKTALVTGSSRSIGASIAAELARRGAAVGINFRTSADEAGRVVEDIAAAGGRAIAVRADVTDAAQTKDMVSRVEAELGAIDILVMNTTGFAEVLRGAALSYTVDDMADEMTSQFRAAMVPAYAVIPGMAERRGGSLIFISDPFARRVVPGGLGHALAKAPVETAMKYLALELGPSGIRVNTVIPGITRTEAYSRLASTKPEIAREAARIADEEIPLRRIAEPEDVACTVATIAGDELSYLTGASIPVTGGHLIL